MPIYSMIDYTEQNRRNGMMMLENLRALMCAPSPQGRADQYAAHCPFHDDDHPSFSLNTQEGIFHCFGCNAEGTVREFSALLDQRGYPPLSLFPPFTNTKIERQKARRQLARIDGQEVFPVDATRVRHCHRVIIDHWHQQLLQDSGVLGIVTQQYEESFSRCFYDRSSKSSRIEKYTYVSPRFALDTVRQFLIGFAAPSGVDLLTLLRTQGFSKDEIIGTGLFRRNGNNGLISDFGGRIVYPYLENGIPVFAIGRITERTPTNLARSKYCYQRVRVDRFILPISRPSLFNADCLLHARSVLITEGITDALKATEAGVPSISPGTIAFQERHSDEIAERLRGKAVFICNDNEKNGSGAKGAEKMRFLLGSRSVEARFIVLPRQETQDKVDVCSFILSEGKDSFCEIIRQQSGTDLQDSADVTSGPFRDFMNGAGLLCDLTDEEQRQAVDLIFTS